MSEENNISYTLAQYTKTLTDKVNFAVRLILEILDKSFEQGQKPDEDIEYELSQFGYNVCVWCKEYGKQPSGYIHPWDDFSKNAFDEELGGSVCDMCLSEREEDETKINKKTN